MTKASARSTSVARPPSATEIESPSPPTMSRCRPAGSMRWTTSTAPALVTSSRPSARHGELGNHVITFGDDRLPRVGATPQHVGIERDTDNPAVRRTEVGDADERHPVGADRERGGGVDPGNHRGPVVVAAIEHVHVGALVADLDVDDEPAAVRGEGDVRPRLGVGTVVPHHRVVAPVGSETVMVDGAVVLVAGGIADVEEPGSVRFPGHRTCPRVRNAIAVTARRRPVGAGDEVEHGVFGPALADADSDERSVVRREVPIDRRRRVLARRCRIEQHDGRRRRIAGGAADEHELLGAGRTLEAEQVGAAECGVLEDRQLHQRHEALVPRGPNGNVERRPGQGVLSGDPGDDFGVVAVFQPAVGISNGGVVIGVNDVLTPSRRDGSRHGHVADRRWSRGSAAAHVGALAVVGLGAPHTRLFLLRLLRHSRPA